MRAWIVPAGCTDASALRLVDRPDPSPAAGQILVRMRAASLNYRDQAVGRCPSCMNETGGGKFCQHCGTPLAAAPAQQKRFCVNCGTPSTPGAMFCAECGQSTA